jgi:membrane protein implicated in regulation of membrane protease activity
MCFNDIVITGWYWLVIGLIFFGIELLAPGTFFLWLGLAALVVAGVSAIHMYVWSVQLILFGITSVIIIWLGRPFYEKLSLHRNGLNQRAHRLIGVILLLDQPIVNGHSRITVGDSTWGIIGPDSKAGVKVKVIEIEGNSLVVEIL